MNLAKLKDPFPSTDIEWRVQSSGLKNGKPWAVVLAYVQSRAIMDRLDDVCGPENWKNSYHPAPDGGIMCSLSIKVGSEWIAKEDGAENTKVEAVKGGISSALKRAGVPWGVGRYLYRLEVGFAQFSDTGRYSAKIEGKYYKWNPPQLPQWALPDGEEPAKVKNQKNDNQNKPSAEETAFNKWFSWIDDVGAECQSIDEFDSKIEEVKQSLSVFSGRYKSNIDNLIGDIRQKLTQ